MIAPSLVEAIWANPLIDRRYAEALRQLCLPADGAPARREGLARLPELFCEANGGDPAQVAPILSAWTLLRYAARILDDIQDGDMVAGEAASAVRLNLSTGLIFTSGALLSELEAAGVTAVAARDIRRTVYATLLQTCGGQHLDLSYFDHPPMTAWLIRLGSWLAPLATNTFSFTAPDRPWVFHEHLAGPRRRHVHRLVDQRFGAPHLMHANRLDHLMPPELVRHDR